LDIQSLLKHLVEFETAIAGLYDWFSQAFVGDADAEFIFYRLAMEERGHVDLIEFQRRLVRKNPAAFPPVEVDFQEIVTLAETVHAARLAAQPPGIDEAVRLALRLERSAAEYHYRTAMRESNPEASRLLDSLGKADQFHVTGLREFAARRGIAIPSE